MATFTVTIDALKGRKECFHCVCMDFQETSYKQ